ncbi:MAG: response regulator, partial [Candidatus Xenobia bacterium]
MEENEADLGLSLALLDYPEEYRLMAPARDLPAVLLVDDNEPNLLAMEQLLLPLPCRVVLARSGMDALRHVLTEEFACILLDVSMPEMDGFETAHLIHSRDLSRHVPILFV